jgi:hypothetical protein
MPAASKSRLIVVKRYARSRLYDTTHSRYVSMEPTRMGGQESGILRHRRRGRCGHHPHSVGLTSKTKPTREDLS